MSKSATFAVLVLAAFIGFGASAYAAPRKHTVVLGAIKRVPYSKTGDPSGAATGEDALKVRALLVDGVLKEWPVRSPAAESPSVNITTVVPGASGSS